MNWQAAKTNPTCFGDNKNHPNSRVLDSTPYRRTIRLYQSFKQIFRKQKQT